MCNPDASATEPVELNRQSTCIPGHPVFRVMLRLCTFRGFYVARDSKWLSKPSTRSWTGTVPPACRPAGQWLTNVGWMSNNVPFLFTKMWSELKMVGRGQWLYSNHRRDLGTVEFRNTKVWLTIFPLLREGNYLNEFRGIETEEDRKAPFLNLALWKTITVAVVAGTEGTLFNVQGEARRADREVKERFPTSTKRVQSLTHTPLQDFHFLLPHRTPEGRKCSKHTGLSAQLWTPNQRAKNNIK